MRRQALGADDIFGVQCHWIFRL